MQERCQRKEQELLMSRQEKNTMSNKGRTDFGIQQVDVYDDTDNHEREPYAIVIPESGENTNE